MFESSGVRWLAPVQASEGAGLSANRVPLRRATPSLLVRPREAQVRTGLLRAVGKTDIPCTSPMSAYALGRVDLLVLFFI